jgi:hypothetical protein
MQFIKTGFFVLLSADVGLYLRYGTANEALEQLAWLILLASFLYESSGLGEAYASRFEQVGLHAAQTIGYGLAVYTCWGYWAAGDTASFVNSAAWLAICALLAYDVYAPGEYGGLEWRVRNVTKAVLYAVVVGLVALWGWQGATNNDADSLVSAYDAAIWIGCFAIVERRIFDFETNEETETGAASG